MENEMRTSISLILFLLLSTIASAQPTNYGCPAGTPAAPWPGSIFVPTTNCQGWVPANHPLARRPVPQQPEPTPAPVGAFVAAQDIYSKLELPSVTRVITSIQGWAVDCQLGTRPPVIRLVETKPDGSMREIPNDFFFTQSIRTDVQQNIRDLCPAVLNAPAGDGSGGLGPMDQFGWSLALKTPITEPGQHTFTAVWSWPSQQHSGSSTVTVTIQ